MTTTNATTATAVNPAVGLGDTIVTETGERATVTGEYGNGGLKISTESNPHGHTYSWRKPTADDRARWANEAHAARWGITDEDDDTDAAERNEWDAADDRNDDR
jgi:hypothetical protein